MVRGVDMACCLCFRSWLLQTKALIMIIFVNILLDKHIITSETFTALLLMAVASTMLTVPAVYPKLQRLKAIIWKEDGRPVHTLQPIAKPTDAEREAA
jgi:hypothetical protein